MPLDVLLITPRSTYVNEIAQKVYPPLNLLYLAASLREKGYAASVLDANAMRMSDEEITGAVREASSALVGIPLYSEILRQVRALARLAKSASACKLVFGGPHASAVPGQVLTQFPEADFLLTGEAEETLPRLTGAVRDHRPMDDIPGLWHRRGSQMVQITARAGRPDIDRIPPPARDLVEEPYRRKRYYTIMVRTRPVDTIMTSRGCPFRCHFCYNNNYQYRGRSPESVLDELTRIRERGIRNVEIVDDHFTTDRSRAMRIFDLVIQEKLGISFRIKSRVDVVDEELLRKARRAGAYLISYGMESGVQRLLDAMNKRTRLEDNARACQLTRRLGMSVHSSWIVGYPGETPETIQQTVDFIVKIKPTTANVAVLRPYPATVVYLQAKEAGTLEGDWHPDTALMPWVRLPWTRSKRDLDLVVNRCWRRIYYRPHYVLSFGGQILRNANLNLARYAAQELRRTIRPTL